MTSAATPQESPRSPTKQLQQDYGSKPDSPVLPPQQQQEQQQYPEGFATESMVSSDISASIKFDRMADSQASLPPKLPQPLQPLNRGMVQTPEPRTSKERLNGQNKEFGGERSPSTPGHLAPFDWDEFETRYAEALSEANDQEQELLEEFERLVAYFNVWASSGSVHDTDRGVKRLQTRERYVKIAEQSLLQKKKHLTEVVRAFQSALALLSQS